jgi:hypothetical protein
VKYTVGGQRRRESTKRTEALEKTLFAIGACGMTETMEEV